MISKIVSNIKQNLAIPAASSSLELGKTLLTVGLNTSQLTWHSLQSMVSNRDVHILPWVGVVIYIPHLPKNVN